MFARLTGTVDTLLPQAVILDVHGVGYLVACSMRTLTRLSVGEAARLLIETQVREDAINLFGFIDAVEQDWFRLLTTVQGVGAKVALAILSISTPDQLVMAVAAQDKAVLTRADGVGPKLATRIVTELKDKVAAGAGTAFAPAPTGKKASKSAAPQPMEIPTDHDAVSALVNLGYGRAEAFAAVMKHKQDAPDRTLSDLIRLSLKDLGSVA